MALGIELGNMAIGAGGGLLGKIGQKKREKRQVGYQKDLMSEQMKNQMMLNEQGKMLGLQQWKDTSFAAQREQMEKAGLNVGLMYGGSGGGGATVASGGGAGGGSAPNVENLPFDIGALQGIAKIKAEVDLLKAQKEKIEGETSNLSKTGANIEASTENLLQDISNKKVQEILTRAQTRNVNLDSEFKGKSMNDSLNVLKWAVDQNESTARSMRAEAYVNEETADSKVDILNAEAVGAWLNNRLASANISKTKEETRIMGENLIQLIRQVDQSGETVDIKSFEADLRANFPSVMNVIGGAGEHALREMLSIFGRGKGYVKRK